MNKKIKKKNRFNGSDIACYRESMYYETWKCSYGIFLNIKYEIKGILKHFLCYTAYNLE